MDYIELNGKKYGYVVNYKEDNQIRSSLNALTRKTYGFDFEQWYQAGYWQERYVPYSLLDGDIVVANASANIIDFLALGEKKRYIQIGTVMTDEAYQNQGLSRVLMEKILSEWGNKCELIYLFANDSVLNFYPKFGFIPTNEYQCTKAVIPKKTFAYVRKLNMSDENDRNLLYNKANQTVPFSKLAMQENVSLVMFYCTSFMKDSVYYIEDFDAVIVADFDKDTLYLQDVFCTKEVLLDDIINAMVNEQMKKVILGFMPIDTSSYEISLLQEEDSTLFVKTNGSNLFDSNQLMFSVLSHA